MFNKVLCYCKVLNNDGNKWLLCDVHSKTRFLDKQKIPKALKLVKCLLKQFPELFGYMTIDFYLLLKIFFVI